jgi:hypothetical protein
MILVVNNKNARGFRSAFRGTLSGVNTHRFRAGTLQSCKSETQPLPPVRQPCGSLQKANIVTCRSSFIQAQAGSGYAESSTQVIPPQWRERGNRMWLLRLQMAIFSLFSTSFPCNSNPGNN